MSTLQDFFMEEFEESPVIEKTLHIGGRPKKMQFKAIPTTVGDEIRKKCRKITIAKGQKITETDNEKFIANMIIETTVYPDLKNAELQKNWGVMGAEDLLKAMKSKMSDGEYAEWSSVVSEVNGYEKSMEDLVEEAKN